MTTLPPESERLVVWNALQSLTNAGKLTTGAPGEAHL